MHTWLGALNLSVGGKTYRLVTEQSRRISWCRLTFFSDRVGAEVRSQGGFVKSSITLSDPQDDQPTLWQDRVLLDEDFYRALCDHPVPLAESALRAIGPRSMVLDVYIWLAYRLHALKRDAEVGWPALYAQFGAGYALIRQFRAHFIESLGIALAAYPDAHVGQTDRGIVLHPSRPAIAARAS
jgi:Plasmid encoded RepA protein